MCFPFFSSIIKMSLSLLDSESSSSFFSSAFSNKGKNCIMKTENKRIMSQVKEKVDFHLFVCFNICRRTKYFHHRFSQDFTPQNFQGAKKKHRNKIFLGPFFSFYTLLSAYAHINTLFLSLLYFTHLLSFS